MKTAHVECTTCSLVCAHCWATDALASLPAEHLIDAVRGFLLRHRRCARPLEPSKQVALFDRLAADERPTAPPPVGIDGMSDEPDPETDPPEHDKPELDSYTLPDEHMFALMYPMARTVDSLWTELVGWALDSEQAGIVMGKPLPAAGSPGFDAIANWSRTEKARQQGQERAALGTSIPGLYIPTVRMPKEMADLIKPALKKRGARPLSSPSPGLPATPPAKKTRKRSSGSTANTP